MPLFENKHALNACWVDVLKQCDETFLWQCRCSSTWGFCFSGVYADKVGIEAAEMLLKNIRHNGCVDEFLQDQVSVRESDTHTRTHSATLLWPYSDSPLQLIIFMALAKGTSRIRTGAVTLHTQTAIHIAEQLTQVRNSYSTRLTQWCLFCSRVTVPVLILLLYLVLVSDAAPQVILGSESSWSVINLVCCCICRQSSQ